jgi:transcriptional antiterminator RfaH
MPLLELKPCIFPENLLESPPVNSGLGRWWVLHTRPRSEKALARRFGDRGTSYYLPLYAREWVSRGRRFNSFLPLFPGYVFLHGDGDDRLSALETNLVAHVIPVEDQKQLFNDLARVRSLLTSGAAVTPEDRLGPGDPVQIVRGPLAGLDGKVIRRGNHLRFIIEVQFLRRAVSAEIEGWMIQAHSMANAS